MMILIGDAFYDIKLSLLNLNCRVTFL